MTRFPTSLICLLGPLLALWPVAFAMAQTDGVVPFGGPVDVKVEDRVGDFLPLELKFKDEAGRTVVLSDFFAADKPVVMTLNYSDCPGLCIAQLEKLVETLRVSSGVQLGRDFELVTISIDPQETPEKAAQAKAKYTQMLGAAGPADSWHFLVGQQADIQTLAAALGYHYSYDRINDRYNHPAVTYFVSSGGRLCRYLLDLGIEPVQFALAVKEAGEGKVTRGLADAFVQMCYFYDPDTNRYSADARRILALASVAFVVLVLGGLAPFWWSSQRRAAAKAPSSPKADAPAQADS